MTTTATRKIFIVLGCFVFPGFSGAQTAARSYNKEIAITTENDAYLFRKHDAYYTNGIFLHYTKAGEQNGKKRIYAFELGQMIYTPLIRLTSKPADVDRPYAGYLFAKYNQSHFPDNKTVIQYGATVGVVGPPSLGEDMQNWYHRLLKYGRFTGWHYQVESAFGADLHVSYARTILEDSSWIRMVPVGEATLGSNFTNASLGMMICLGKLSGNTNSALWNARVQEKGRAGTGQAEVFFYWYPQVTAQGYNVTVEGGLFTKSDTAAVLGTTSHWVFQQTFGACFAKGRWTTKLAFVYQTREAENQVKAQQYGSLQVGYRIH